MTSKVLTWVTFTLVLLCDVTTSDSNPGHLQPLGSQRPPEGHVEMTSSFPHPIRFFNEYAKASKPVVFKGVAKKWDVFNKWNDDEYLRKTFGHLEVDIEEGKKENRSLGSWRWPLSEFLDKYQKEDVYMVNSLPTEMLGDLHLPAPLTCGGFTNTLQDVIMWFSSGGTKSVLHTDSYDNLNCLFTGSKRLYMVDRKHAEFINIDNPEGSHSKVDVDAVDLDKYPGLAHAPWWEARMEAGDCLYIPLLWFHQVTSYTDPSRMRNMAVNTWFINMNRINQSDCSSQDEPVPQSIPMNTVAGKAKLPQSEMIRFLLKLQLEGKDEMLRKDFIKSLMEMEAGRMTREEWKEFLRTVDKNKDKMISLEELNVLDETELKKIARWVGLHDPREEEEEEEGEEEGAGEEEGVQGGVGEVGGEGEIQGEGNGEELVRDEL